MPIPVSVFFKLTNQSLAANVCGTQIRRLLYVTDNYSHLSFLVDTGAAAGVLPIIPKLACRSLAILKFG